ncbi:MAG: hypothetical protein V3W34_07830 [Phycisphaerae bacterium]
MSARYSTWIRIGGRIERSDVDPLLKAITKAYVSLEWGEPPFKPTAADELLDARQQDGWLWLCDQEAKYGEFPELEETCRRLGLPYTRFAEGWCGCDPELLDWRPGMKEPLIRTGSNDDCEKTFVATDSVNEALTALEAGHVQQAVSMLRKLCPEVAELPPFEIV